MRNSVKFERWGLLIGLVIGALVAGPGVAEELRTGFTDGLGTFVEYVPWWWIFDLEGDNLLVGQGVTPETAVIVANNMVPYSTDQFAMSAVVYSLSQDLGFLWGANLTAEGGILALYYVDFEVRFNEVTLGKIVDNVDTSLVSITFDDPLAWYKWYDLAVVMSDGVMQVWLDGILIIEYDDSAEAIPSGMAGMYVQNWGVGVFDNFILRQGVPPETVDLNPKTLNERSKVPYITCYIEVPGHDVADIDRSTILLAGVVPAEPGPSTIGDWDQDGEPDLMVKFDLQQAMDLVPLTVGDHNLAVTWYTLDGRPFKARDTIHVVSFGKP